MTVSADYFETVNRCVDAALTYEQIAKATSKSKSAVYALCQRNNWKARRWQDPALRIRDKAICEMYSQGRTLQECGDAYRMTRERVRQILEKEGFDKRR